MLGLIVWNCSFVTLAPIRFILNSFRTCFQAFFTGPYTATLRMCAVWGGNSKGVLHSLWLGESAADLNGSGGHLRRGSLVPLAKGVAQQEEKTS